jgi:Txe/YoeB family toxin of Txe-Axe toxin-antitoxin module
MHIVLPYNNTHVDELTIFYFLNNLLIYKLILKYILKFHDITAQQKRLVAKQSNQFYVQNVRRDRPFTKKKAEKKIHVTIDLPSRRINWERRCAEAVGPPGNGRVSRGPSGTSTGQTTTPQTSWGDGLMDKTKQPPLPA